MRVNDFLNLVAQHTRAELPASFGRFQTWKRYTLIQIYFSKRSVHYEVWVRGGNVHSLEIGLHCEADAATNRALLETLDAHLFEIKDALGEQIEAEEWTKSWTRVHELMPYEKLDEETAQATGRKLAKMISVIQPLIASGVGTRTPQTIGKVRPAVRAKTKKNA
jgi:hypothetical protein